MKKPLYKIVRSGVFAAMISISSFIVVPIGPVPVSASLLAVMLCSVILSPFESFCASLVYIIMGAVGLPVFSGGSGGIGVLFGYTGGYIWSYPLLSIVISLFSQFKRKRKIINYVITFCGCLIGMIISYTLGTAQYMLVTGNNILSALFTCVLPFLFIDLIKSIIAVSIGIPFKKRLNKLNHIK